MAPETTLTATHHRRVICPQQRSRDWRDSAEQLLPHDDFLRDGKPGPRAMPGRPATIAMLEHVQLASDVALEVATERQAKSATVLVLFGASGPQHQLIRKH